MKNKKGLSDVVTVVLIILLALAAVVIVANFILPFIRGTGGELTTATQCLDISVEPTVCSVANGVTIKLVSAGDTPPADITLKALVEQGTDILVGTIAAPESGGTADVIEFFEGTTATAITDGSTVTAAAVLNHGQDDEYTCTPSTVSETCTATP